MIELNGLKNRFLEKRLITNLLEPVIEIVNKSPTIPAEPLKKTT